MKIKIRILSSGYHGVDQVEQGQWLIYARDLSLTAGRPSRPCATMVIKWN